MGQTKSTQEASTLRCKLILVGDTQVGKTALVKSLKHEYIDHDAPTVGCELTVHYFNIKGANAKLLIMDSLTEADLSLECRMKSIKNCDVAAIVFSLANGESWRRVPEKVSWLKGHGYTKNQVALIGTHADLSSGEVQENEIKEFIEVMDDYQLVYFSTSARNRVNIDEAFTKCLEIGIGNKELRWKRIRTFVCILAKIPEEEHHGLSFANICEALPNLLARKKRGKGFPISKLSEKMCTRICEFLQWVRYKFGCQIVFLSCMWAGAILIDGDMEEGWQFLGSHAYICIDIDGYIYSSVWGVFEGVCFVGQRQVSAFLDI